MRLLVLAALLAAVIAPASLDARVRAHCGVERWPVKTLQDAAAASVDYTPKATSVSQLVALAAPRDPTGRVPASAETQAWRLSGVRLVAYKQEADQDFHLELRSPVTGQTMIAEIPDPACAAGSARLAAITRARSDFVSEIGTPSTTRFATTNVPVRIVGVGFFDRIHGQRGVAPNGVELHPVLSFRRLR